jgi:hypothetical protein
MVGKLEKKHSNQVTKKLSPSLIGENQTSLALVFATFQHFASQN